MTTKLKSQTVRFNGARSRGPVTEEGKRIASKNSIRHAMLSQTVVLDGESNRDSEPDLLPPLTFAHHLDPGRGRIGVIAKEFNR